MTSRREKNVLGVLGGMGPLASAEFIRTIYEYSLSGREQDSPAVLLHSDPSFPDRTDAFLAGDCDGILCQLDGALHSLTAQGATRIVVCCMTIHYLLPRLAEDVRGRIVSLLDVCFDNLPPGRHLLISSSGTRKLGLFENHSRWQSLKQHVVLPDEEDQRRIHYDLIYPIKRNPDLSELTPLLESLLAKYRVDSFIAGCSEIHLLAKRYLSVPPARRRYTCVDPLTIIARQLAEESQ